MTLFWENKLDCIFEAVEDEEEVEIDIRGDEEQKDELDVEEVDVENIAGMSILSIPNPKPGKTLADLKKTYGPPWMIVDGQRVAADPTIQYNEEAGKYERQYKRPMGKITQKVYDKMPEELQTQYKPVKEYDPDTSEDVVSYYEPSRNTIDQEYIGTPEDPWTFDEVVSALKPSLMSRAFRTKTATMSQDEAAVTGINAIRKAWLTDLGIAPFPMHVFKMIRTEIERAAAEASPVSGMKKSKGGTVDPYRSSKMAVSADAPMGGEDQEASFASVIPGSATSGTELAKRQEQQDQLIRMLIDNAGLNAREALTIYHSTGLSPAGGHLEDGEQSIKKIAGTLGVSAVRASQIRKSAMQKLQNYLSEMGYGTEEAALEKLGIEEALVVFGKAIVESIKQIIELEIEMLQEHQIIKMDTVIDGINYSTIAKVRSEDLKLIEVLDESNRNITNKVDNKYITEAQNIAAAKTSDKYFTEMAATVINMKTMPILAVVGDKINDANDDDDDNDNNEESI